MNVQGETQKKLDVHSNEVFIRMNEQGGYLAGMASEEMELPYQIPAPNPRGKYLLVFDPLDGSSNIDVNVSVGSIFSILRAPKAVVDSGRDVTEADFLQPGTQQVAAGYALYGPTTMLVLTVGNGVSAFTLDPNLGEFMLTHAKMQIPADTHEFYEATPVAMIMEQAGGRASTGRQPMLGVQPSSLHQRIGLVFGSKNEVERIERYHTEPVTSEPDNPLFAQRGLFRF